ncbi:MAG: hypothetical protein DRP75_04155 [Candidatus Omnitrophota bacterium]|nr:MAG: hypothetical protein DRP75_04155 [Candidatus Omnitrophota bacterium]
MAKKSESSLSLSGAGKFLFGIFLSIFALILTYSFLKLLSSFRIEVNEAYFLLGAGSYALFHFLFRKPFLPYIFGHELSHALSILLLKGKVKKIHISAQRGSVKGTKTNFFIALSPYLFPIYSLAIVIVYLLLSIFLDVRKYLSFFLFLIGFTWAFHLLLTVYFLSQRQRDIIQTGRLFSFSLIYTVNLLTLVFILSCLSKHISFEHFLLVVEKEIRKVLAYL